MAAVAALTASLLLLASGAAHARRPAALRAALLAHGVVHRVPLVVRVLPAVELAAGGAAAVVLAAGRPRVLAVLLAGQALLFAGFAAYLSRVSRAGGRGLACGCGLPDVPVGPSAVARAGALAVLAASAAAGTLVAGLPRDAASAVVVAGGAPTLALLLGIVQAARTQPLVQPALGIPERLERGAPS